MSVRWFCISPPRDWGACEEVRGRRGHAGRGRLGTYATRAGTNAPTGAYRQVSTVGVGYWAIRWWRGFAALRETAMALEDEERSFGWREAAAAQGMSPADADPMAGIRWLLVSEGSMALFQVLVTAAAGYFSYLTCRVPAVPHGLWDFRTNSAVAANKSYLGAGLFVLADVIMVIILLLRWHRIEPARNAGPVQGVI